MDAYRRSQMHRLGAAALALVATSLLSAPVIAQRAKLAKPVSKEPARDAAFADYRSWKAVNAEPTPVPPQFFFRCSPVSPTGPDGPHGGGFVNIYVNPVGRAAYVGEKPLQFSPGTVIVKEKLAQEDEQPPHELGVMIKREAGYAPDAGDWQYVFVDRQGAVSDNQSKLKCAKCHQIQAENDYVYRRVRLTDKAADDD